MNRIKHIEFAGRDGETLETFYAGLFGWPIKRRDAGGFAYSDIELPGDLSGGIRHEPDGEPETVIYVEVENVDAAAQKAEVLGAKIRIPPMDYGQIRFALIADPEGNAIGLTQPADGT